MIQSEPNYIVVLFKNKSKKKIINKFKTKERAVAFYKKLIEENDVIFDITKNSFIKIRDFGVYKPRLELESILIL